MKPPPRSSSSVACELLATHFDLPINELMQDWELEVADATRLGEFVDFYETAVLDDNTRFALMQLIVYSLDDALYGEVSKETEAMRKRIEVLLRGDFLLHLHTVEYWRFYMNYIDPDHLADSEYTFPVTPMMREVWQGEFRPEYREYLAWVPVKREAVSVTARDGVQLAITKFWAEKSMPAVTPVPVLLIHGWPNAIRVWQWLIELMALDGSIFYAPDLRGFGVSEKPETGYTCESFADDIEDIVQELGLTRYALIGHSMGGKIAQTFAGRQPAGLAALILVSPALPTNPPTPEDRKAAQRALFCQEQAIRERLIPSMAAHPLPPTYLDSLVEDALATGQNAWNGWVNVMRDEDISAQTATISVPTLVIHGGKDPLRSREDLERTIVQRIPRACLNVLPNVGHLAHVEEPEGLAIAAEHFLAEHLK